MDYSDEPDKKYTTTIMEEKHNLMKTLSEMNEELKNKIKMMEKRQINITKQYNAYITETPIKTHSTYELREIVKKLTLENGELKEMLRNIIIENGKILNDLIETNNSLEKVKLMDENIIQRCKELEEKESKTNTNSTNWKKDNIVKSLIQIQTELKNNRKEFIEEKQKIISEKDEHIKNLTQIHMEKMAEKTKLIESKDYAIKCSNDKYEELKYDTIQLVKEKDIIINRVMQNNEELNEKIRKLTKEMEEQTKNIELKNNSSQKTNMIDFVFIQN